MSASSQRAPRVLVVGSVLSQPMGGVRRHVMELLPRAAKVLRERGGALGVLTGREGLPFELGPQVELLASSIPAQPAALRATLESGGIRSALDNARAAGRPFELVHTAHLPLPRGLDAPQSFTVHDLKSVFSASEPTLRRWVGRCVISDALRRARVVFTVSHTLRSELIEQLGAPPDKLVALPNGCDHLPLRAREPSHDAPLLFVGHLEPRKNVETLLRALALAPDLGRLQLAGAAKRGEREKLEALARELGVLARVEFLGLVDDAALAQLYSRCRAVVLPSLREGFDLPLAEALRARAPLACSDLAVHHELAGPHASYFEPTSAEALVAAVRSAREPGAHCALTTWDECAQRCVEGWISAASPR